MEDLPATGPICPNTDPLHNSSCTLSLQSTCKEGIRRRQQLLVHQKQQQGLQCCKLYDLAMLTRSRLVYQSNQS